MFSTLVNTDSLVLTSGMTRFLFIIWSIAILGYAEHKKWNPVLVPEKKEGLINSDRKLEVFEHGMGSAYAIGSKPVVYLAFGLTTLMSMPYFQSWLPRTDGPPRKSLFCAESG